MLLDTLVSSLELTRCTSITAQVTGQTPTILLDNTDSAQIFLSEQGLSTSVITAKCSAINICVPMEGGEPGDYEELALPEQLKHAVSRSGKKAQVTSEVVHHAG